MLQKQEFYYGVAITRLLEDVRCGTLAKSKDGLGYTVNNNCFFAIKYTTKARSPWQFTFSWDEASRLNNVKDRDLKVLALVCGGDGVCALTWSEIYYLLDFDDWMQLLEKESFSRTISIGRRFNERYAVWGTARELKRKISLNRWPQIILDINE